ncbi:MAG: EamA family transporter [Candidatus Eisenbacteria bacterium]|nr:EamA family transporter [Candidatus Eisenbacteria bacterium]
MGPSLKPFLLIVVAVCFSVTGELLLKSGMTQIGVLGFENFWRMMGRILSSPRILGGYSLFAVGAFFWLAAISRVPLSWAYPMLAIGYVLVLVLSATLLREHVSLLRWGGVLLICVGIVLVFRS